MPMRPCSLGPVWQWGAEPVGRHSCLTGARGGKKLPIRGKGIKTGQTLMKTIIAPGLKARMLGVHGWFSTNILGNRDGDVLHDSGSFRTKEQSKLSVLDYIRQPDLYQLCTHATNIRCIYTTASPAATTRKAGITSISCGWLDYPMQIKLNFLCRAAFSPPRWRWM